MELEEVVLQELVVLKEEEPLVDLQHFQLLLQQVVEAVVVDREVNQRILFLEDLVDLVEALLVLVVPLELLDQVILLLLLLHKVIMEEQAHQIMLVIELVVAAVEQEPLENQKLILYHQVAQQVRVEQVLHLV